ncbi:DUF2157 domain-containing protein [Wenzhouxiangella sp. XN201]|uniref:DUF2157 domain-containing protein n=1 Tax=Wenzhouxiangella sp. XN201 TaxID=2710755 RepID=UPI0013CA7FF7|nr:DUF2157 domain-containing protein [Wenzhouxiangella sp. XN201]NEZ05136.1 DUF2157 domain-containing protein [Wenzhouxiangella sp. XN201]
MSQGNGPPQDQAAAHRQEAQSRADRIQAFRDELCQLEAEGAVALDTEIRQSIDLHHDRLLAEMAERFDIDTDGSGRQLSLGMRIASLIGALALSAAVFFFFYQIWGFLITPLQVGLLITAPILAILSADWMARRERTHYLTSLLALVALACFVLNLSMLGQIFNIAPDRTAFLVWSLFALLLAYAWGLKLVLVAALACLAGYVSATLGAWGGMYWLSFGQRPEDFLIAGLLITVPGWLQRLPRSEFAPVYRVFGLLMAFISVLIMSFWGEGSYLPLAPAIVEGSYQVLGFVGSAGVIWLGIRRADGKLFHLGATFFVLFLYTKVFDWWWDWLPKWLFFLVVGLIAIGVLFGLGRLRHSRREAST